MTTAQPVLVIMGVSGSGKSTVAGLLAGRLGWDLQEGDDLHPASNVAKMSSGVPLTDDDRWPWLDRVADWIVAHTAAGDPGLITCSALKRSYRDRLRGERVVFVVLTADKAALAERLAVRLDHFMPPELLDSQIATLEMPTADENALVVETSGTAAETTDHIIRQLGLGATPAPGPSPSEQRPSP
ncbi:MAG: gluconokinase [Pseudonocardia sp.]|nr:gluconokinase [Pseudonocardia sp.]